MSLPRVRAFRHKSRIAYAQQGRIRPQDVVAGRRVRQDSWTGKTVRLLKALH
jgi:hypothetical protein